MFKSCSDKQQVVSKGCGLPVTVLFIAASVKRLVTYFEDRGKLNPSPLYGNRSRLNDVTRRDFLKYVETIVLCSLYVSWLLLYKGNFILCRLCPSTKAYMIIKDKGLQSKVPSVWNRVGGQRTKPNSIQCSSIPMIVSVTGLFSGLYNYEQVLPLLCNGHH